MPGTRYLLISDLHLGHPGALLSSPRALELLEAELEQTDVLVLAGDVFDFFHANVATCLEASRPFFEMAGRHVSAIYFVPGNHDYHFVAHDTDRALFSGLTGGPTHPAFRLQTAEWTLASLLAPAQRRRVEVKTFYPLLELDGITVIHGHYVDTHLGGVGRRIAGRIARRLAGLEAKSAHLSPADYEALLAPLAELLYRTAQLPNSRRAFRQSERLLAVSSSIARAPQALARRLQRAEGVSTIKTTSPFALVDHEESIAAMSSVCSNLGIAPGPVVFGHTHTPFADLASANGEHRFYNTGSWFLDVREARLPHYRQLAWPGSLLRISDGRIELRRLLDDFDLDQVGELAAVPTPRARRHKGRRRQSSSGTVARYG